MDKIKKIAWSFPLIAGICWGAAGFFVRSLTEAGLTNVTITCLRMLLAGLINAVIIVFYKPSLFRIDKKDLIFFALCGVIGMGILNVLYNLSVLKGSLVLAAVLLGLSPIFVLFGAVLVLHEPITMVKSISVILAIVGCAMVSGLFDGGKTNVNLIAVIAGLGAAVFYAANGVLSKKIADKNYHFLTTSFYCSIFAGLSLVPFSQWHQTGSILIGANCTPLIILLLHVILTSVFPYAIYFLGMKYLEAGKAAILASGQPASAMVFGLVLYNEVPTVLGIIGLVFCILSIVLLNLPQKS